MRTAPNLWRLAAQRAGDPAPGVRDARASFTQDLAAVVVASTAGTRGAGTRVDDPSDSEWLPECKTATDELRRLRAAAAQIRNARIAQRHAPESHRVDTPLPNERDRWEHVVANAAREAARVSAQLAYFGLDIGSIAVVRRKADNNMFKALEVHFCDGDQVRSPCLIIACYRDGILHYGWLGRKPEPGTLDHAKDLSPQIRRLVLRLCELVAQGYVADAHRVARIETATSTQP